MSSAPSSLQILRIRGVVAKFQISRSQLYLLLKQEGFPKPIPLGGSRAVGFFEHELDAWLKAQAAKRAA